jgi:hypothetical protein
MSDTAQVAEGAATAAPAGENGQAATAPAEGAAAPEAKEKRPQAGMYISTPPNLKARIEQEATAAGVAPRVFVRDFLAKTWGLTLEPARTRSTYANPEEKAEAQKAKRIERQDLIKKLLAAHRQAQTEGKPVVVAPEATATA